MKVHYDKYQDILMLVLSNKKIDDSYETENSIISVSKDGEPVMIDIFRASEFLKDLGKVVPAQMKKDLWQDTPVSVPHRSK